MRTLRSFAPSGLACAITIAAGLQGCSAVVSDVGGVMINPEACVQGGNTEVLRDAHLVFAEMDPHAQRGTFIALVGGATSTTDETRHILRGRAAVRPSFAAQPFDIAALASSGDCAMVETSPLTMTIDIPSFIPADSANGGPFTLDFWSDVDGTLVNGEPARQFPGDHSWARPMCDDGDVFFVHNTGFDQPVEAETNGLPLRIEFDEAGARAATNEVVANALEVVPMVVEVKRQGQTVAYLRTVMRCDTSYDEVGETLVHYVFGGVLDAGNEHTYTVYWDVDQDGVHTDACDPQCTGTFTAPDSGPSRLRIGGAAANVNLAGCGFPENIIDNESCR